MAASFKRVGNGYEKTGLVTVRIEKVYYEEGEHKDPNAVWAARIEGDWDSDHMMCYRTLKEAKERSLEYINDSTIWTPEEIKSLSI